MLNGWALRTVNRIVQRANIAIKPAPASAPPTLAESWIVRKVPIAKHPQHRRDQRDDKLQRAKYRE